MSIELSQEAQSFGALQEYLEKAFSTPFSETTSQNVSAMHLAHGHLSWMVRSEKDDCLSNLAESIQRVVYNILKKVICIGEKVERDGDDLRRESEILSLEDKEKVFFRIGKIEEKLSSALDRIPEKEDLERRLLQSFSNIRDYVEHRARLEEHELVSSAGF